MFISQDSGQITGPSRDGPRHFGHAHFWERAMMSRRKFIGAAAGTTGAILGAGLWMPKLALAAGSDPNPIVGVADVQGTGTGINTRTGFHETLTYDTDVRFMQGIYIGMDGKQYSDTFGFI